MKMRFAGVFALIFLFCASCATVNQFKKHRFLESTATVRITSIGDDSDKSCTVEYTSCTAVAFAKNGIKYQFFTAAHCVARYDKEISKTVLKESVLQLIIGGSVYPAKVLNSKEKGPAVGEFRDFEDFAILEAEIDEDIQIMPLADLGPELNEDLLVVTSPPDIDIGLLQIRGYVSVEKINNLEIKMDGKNEEDVFNMPTKDAFGAQFLGLGTGFGTSGGGVFSVKRGAIVGIVSATDHNTQNHVTLIICPITMFNNFRKEYEQGKRLTLSRPLLKK